MTIAAPFVRTGASDRATWRAVAVAGAIVVAHAPSFARPLLDSDEAVYASIAALVNSGGRLYAEGGVDNKFPGIYFTYAAVFRVFGRYAMAAVHALALLVVLASAAILARIARRIGGADAGLIAALFYGLFTTFYYPKMLAANTEVFMTLPLAASVLLALPDENDGPADFRALLISGALVGVATMYRQLAALNLVLVCSASLLARGTRTRRGIGAIAPVLGFSAALAVLGAVFAAQGTLHDFWFWTVTMVTTRYLPGGWAYRWPALQLLAMCGVMCVPAGLSVLRLRRVRDKSLTERLVWGWLVLGVLAILALWRFHPHYVIHAVAPLSVLAALEFAHQRRRAIEPGRRRWTGYVSVIIGLASVAYVGVALALEPIAGGLSPPRPDYPSVARAIAARTGKNQPVFVWGAYAPLYVLSDRLPASRFVGFMRGCPRTRSMRLGDCWDSGPAMWPLLLRDFERTPPELIVDTAAADYGDFGVYPIADFPVLRDFVASHYSLATLVNGVPLYRRDRSASRPHSSD